MKVCTYYDVVASEWCYYGAIVLLVTTRTTSCLHPLGMAWGRGRAGAFLVVRPKQTKWSVIAKSDERRYLPVPKRTKRHPKISHEAIEETATVLPPPPLRRRRIRIRRSGHRVLPLFGRFGAAATGTPRRRRTERRRRRREHQRRVLLRPHLGRCRIVVHHALPHRFAVRLRHRRNVLRGYTGE